MRVRPLPRRLGPVLWVPLALLAFALPPLRASNVAPVGAQAQDRKGSLADLPWIVPSPLDLDAPGYGLRSSQYETLAAAAAAMYSAGEEQAAYAAGLEDAGWKQAYLYRLGLPSEDDPDLLERALYVELTEFGDEGGAEDGLGLLREAYAGFGLDEGRTAPEVGDEAVSFRGAGADATTGNPYKDLKILFRTGAFVVDMGITDYTDDAPALSEWTAVGETIVERIAAAEAGDAPGLGVAVLRVDGEGVTHYDDSYLRVDGEEIPLVNQATSARRSNQEYYDDLGVTDRYFYVANWGDPAAPDEPLTGYSVGLYRFEDEDAAETFAGDDPEAWAEFPPTGVDDVEFVDDLPTVGDESTAVSFAFERAPGEVALGYRAWIRVGETVATVELTDLPDVSRAAFEELSQGVASCLEAGTCRERVELSAAFLAAGAADGAGTRDDEPGADEESSGGADRAGDEEPAGDGRRSDAETTPDADDA